MYDVQIMCASVARFVHNVLILEPMCFAIAARQPSDHDIVGRVVDDGMDSSPKGFQSNRKNVRFYCPA